MDGARDADALTAYFVGLVPDTQLRDELFEFMARNGAEPLTDAHVTVKSQFGLTEPTWLEAVERAARSCAPARVTLGGASFFGREILYLPADEGDANTIHRAILAECTGETHEYEGEGYVPHVTLGATWLGQTRDQLASMVDETNARFAGRSFVCDHLTVFRTTDGHTYAPWRTIGLGEREG